MVIATHVEGGVLTTYCTSDMLVQSEIQLEMRVNSSNHHHSFPSSPQNRPRTLSHTHTNPTVRNVIVRLTHDFLFMARPVAAPKVQRMSNPVLRTQSAPPRMRCRRVEISELLVWTICANNSTSKHHHQHSTNWTKTRAPLVLPKPRCA